MAYILGLEIKNQDREVKKWGMLGLKQISNLKIKDIHSFNRCPLYTFSAPNSELEVGSKEALDQHFKI